MMPRGQISVMKRETLFNKAPIFIQNNIASHSSIVFFWGGNSAFLTAVKRTLKKSTEISAKTDKNRSGLTQINVII